MFESNSLNDIFEGRRTQYIVTAVVAGIVVLVDSVGRWALTTVTSIGVRPMGLAVLLLAVTIGTEARWGLAFGFFTSGVLFNDYAGGVALGTAAFVAAIICTSLWKSYDRRSEWARWILQYEYTALITVLGFAATHAWLNTILNQAAFAITVVQTTTATLPLTMAGAPLVWLLVSVAVEKKWQRTFEVTSRRQKLSLTGTVLVWTVCGYLGSYLYQAVGLIPPSKLAGIPVLKTVVALSGTQGRWIIGLLGLIMISIVVSKR